MRCSETLTRQYAGLPLRAAHLARSSRVVVMISAWLRQ